MTALAARGTVTSLALGAIRFYQKWISPYKGFRCAHHALHQSGSCSHYGYQVFSSHSVFEAFGLLQERFRECREAYNAMVASGQVEDKRRRRSGGSSTGGGSKNSSFDCLPDPCTTFFVVDACTPSAGACDAAACDVGACEIGACS